MNKIRSFDFNEMRYSYLVINQFTKVVIIGIYIFLLSHKPKEKYQCLPDESKIMGLWNRIKIICGCSERNVVNPQVSPRRTDTMTTNEYDNFYSMGRTPSPKPVQGNL